MSLLGRDGARLAAQAEIARRRDARPGRRGRCDRRGVREAAFAAVRERSGASTSCEQRRPGGKRPARQDRSRALAPHARGEPHRHVPLHARGAGGDDRRAVPAGSSTSRALRGSSATAMFRPTARRSTASSASPARSRSSARRPASPSTRCAPATPRPTSSARRVANIVAKTGKTESRGARRARRP